VIRLRSLLLVAPFVLAPVVGVGCSNEDGRAPFVPEPEQPPFQPDGGTCSAEGTCTPDLRASVDCKGVVTECAPGLACRRGECVSACEAAVEAQSTIGCEYVTALPTGGPLTEGSCYAVMLANVSDTPVEFELWWGEDRQLSTSYIRRPRGSGKNIDYELLPDGKLPPGELAIAFLSARKPAYDPDWAGTACPEGVGAAISEAAWVTNGGRGKAFRLKSSAPVVAYDMYPYGGASTHYPSSSLLLPVSAWGKNYVAVDGYTASSRMGARGFYPYMQVIAAEDDTTVTLLPTVTLGGGPGLADAPAGAPYTTKLARGEFLQFAQKDELNGTIVESDKPVGVVGGNQCADIPVDKVACDTLHQALPSVALMGDAYVATRYRDRRSSNDTNLEIVPWRIVGAVDGTELRYDPEIPDAPKKIGRGEVVEFFAPGPFVVRSQDKQHPIYVASYMTAGETAPYSGGSGGMGDPEFVNVAPLDQYLSNYVFLTDPTFGNTNLVFVRKKTNDAPEVMLDCLGPVTGWQQVGSSEFEMARTDLMFFGQPVADCANGVHRAWSDAPFGLTVWGFDDYASYGYVAGMGAKPLNEVRVPVVN